MRHESRAEQIDRALETLDDIHTQLARGALFRGYRAGASGAMGLIMLLGAAVEVWMREPLSAQGHAWHWIAVAAVCGVVGVADYVFRGRLRDSNHQALLALRQLAPSLIVGLAITPILFDRAELLPGVWTMLFGLGLVASAPFLPTAIFGVGAFYLVSGAAMAYGASGGVTPSPWGLGITFGVGQFVAAAILRRTERVAARGDA